MSVRVMGSNQLYLCATPEGGRDSPSQTLLAHYDAFLRPKTFAGSQEMQNVSSSLLIDTPFFLSKAWKSKNYLSYSDEVLLIPLFRKCLALECT